MKEHQYWVYFMTNKSNTVLYTGVTNDLLRRVYEHNNHMVEGFTDKYNIEKLIWFEEHNDIRAAIEREKS